MEAIDIIRKKDPDLLVEGGMHADVAVSTEILQKRYPFSVLESEANVLIFPDLMSANTAYKLLEQLGEATSIGPILLGMSKPVHVLQAFASTVQDIVNITAIAVLDAQSAKIC
jgi:malate dehydrogenase (oxaloacetate-decarboxylating)(NADP+)